MGHRERLGLVSQRIPWGGGSIPDSQSTVLPASYQSRLEVLIKDLQDGLGANLYSCVLYGSAVRGDIAIGVSDLNVLIVLRESKPDAHLCIARALRGKIRIEPFVLGLDGLEGSFHSFALKFRSIQRNYSVLAGVDPFESFSVDTETLRFLMEQGLRNLRLRSVRAYIHLHEDAARYREFLLHFEPMLFIELSELLRLRGVEIPHDFVERIDLLKSSLGIDGSLLRSLLELKSHQRRLKRGEVDEIHGRLYALLDRAVHAIQETHSSDGSG